MAKRGTRKKTGGGLDWGGSIRPEIVGILLLLVALLTLLSLIPVERGALMQRWIELLRLGVGWGVWLMPVGFGGVGLWLIFVGLGRQPEIEREKPWGVLLLFVLGLALLHLIASGEDPLALAREGGGGGYVGYGLSSLLVSGLGTPAAVLVLVTLSVVSMMMLLGMSVGEMWMALSDAVRSLRKRIQLPEFSGRSRGNASPMPQAPQVEVAQLEAETPQSAAHATAIGHSCPRNGPFPCRRA